MSEFDASDVVQLCLGKLSDLYGTSVRLDGTKPIGGGCISHAQKISTSVGDFFLKWNMQAPPDLFQKEAEGLNEMRGAGNPFLVVPKVVWSKVADDSPGLLLTEFMQPAASVSGFDERLGRGIARLHRKTAKTYGFHHPNYCGTTVQDNTWTTSWSEFFAQCRIWALVLQIGASRGMSSGEQRIYETLVTKLPQILDHPTEPSLIHGDLWSGNYLFTAGGPALIDPACYYADREMELGMMQLFGGFSLLVWRAYQDEFPLPEGWQKRIRLYQLYHLLNHQLMFGGLYGSQALEIAKRYV